MPATAQPHYVGLDIAKARLDYCLGDTAEGHCPNTPAGRRELLAALAGLDRPRVVCEASGGYERAVVAELLAAGLEVCVVRPARVHAFAGAEGPQAKTDRLDARLLRRYGAAIQPRLARPPDPRTAGLRELLDCRRLLLERAAEVEGRRELAGPALGPFLRREAAFLARELAKAERLLAAHLRAHPELRARADRLQLVVGVGPILAATLLAYVPELGEVSGPELAALVGVAPFARDSGGGHAPRHLRGGRAPVRHVLYMAATSAATHNPILAAFYQRLLARGKPRRVCLVAVMRKLLCLLNRLIQKPDFVLAS